MTFHPFGQFDHANRMPMNEAKDHVMEEEDPTICFVKAYARKPLGEPKNKKKTPAANAMHRDYYEDEYEGYDDGFDDYSDSE